MKASIIMSAISILNFLFAIFFGAWIHSNGNVIVDGTNLLEVHFGQGIGTMIITLITLGLIAFRKWQNKRVIMIIASILCMIGVALTWVSGWFLYNYDGLVATFARLIHAHEFQAVSTAILTIILLVIVIIRETGKIKEINPE
jgi:hypothetical protein